MGLQEWIQELIARERESGARLEYIMCGASWGLYRDTTTVHRTIESQPFSAMCKSIQTLVLFDAIDECNDDELGKVHQLIQTLCDDANIGDCLTTRPHITGLLRMRFGDSIYMENFLANEKDVWSALEQQIETHREYIETALKDEIICKIVRNVTSTPPAAVYGLDSFSRLYNRSISFEPKGNAI